MDIIAKTRKKDPMVISKNVKINKQIESDINEFEKEFPDVDMPKLFRMGFYMAMDAVRKESKK